MIRKPNLALDRIIDIEKIKDLTYERNITIKFEHYFDDIVDVTHPNNAENEHITSKKCLRNIFLCRLTA